LLLAEAAAQPLRVAAEVPVVVRQLQRGQAAVVVRQLRRESVAVVARLEPPEAAQ